MSAPLAGKSARGSATKRPSRNEPQHEQLRKPPGRKGKDRDLSLGGEDKNRKDRYANSSKVRGSRKEHVDVSQMHNQKTRNRREKYGQGKQLKEKVNTVGKEISESRLCRR